MSLLARPTRRYDYIANGAAIYDESFATIRREARFDHLPGDAERVAVRMVHGTGQTDLTDDLVIHPRLVSAARGALDAGAPIITDANMLLAAGLALVACEWSSTAARCASVGGAPRKAWSQAAMAHG